MEAVVKEINIPNQFVPRKYQFPFFKAMDSGVKRACLVWHRRSGKSKSLLNFTIKKAFERVGIYYHSFPELNQGRKVLWDGIDKDELKLLDVHIPKELRRSTNKGEMKIELINGSIWQIIGADNYNSLVGPNPVGLVLDEWAVSSRYPMAWDYFRPILAENKGWAVFPYTPRGKNHGWTLYDMAQNNPSWFAQILTCDDTGAIGADSIQAEREAGMPEQMVQQEFFCSFDASLVACFFEGVLSGFKPCTGEYGNIDDEEFNEDKNGLVELWRHPYFLLKDWDEVRYENRYCIGSDISEGLGRNWSVAYVFDRVRREFVAKIATNKINSHIWGDRLYELSKYYENALIVPERNGAGITTIDRLTELGANVYFKTVIGAIGKQLTRQYGYLETREAKQLVCGGLKSFLNGANGNKPRIFDRVLLSECSTFIKDEKRERLGAEDGFFDDHVIAAALALHGDFYLPTCEKINTPESSGWRNNYGRDTGGDDAWVR